MSWTLSSLWFPISPFCSSCRCLWVFVCFFNPHVLTLNHVTGCHGRGGVGFMTGEVYLWAGVGFMTGDSVPVAGAGFMTGDSYLVWCVMTDSTEPTLKASSFLNDVKKQRRWCNKGCFFLLWCFLRVFLCANDIIRSLEGDESSPCF